MAIILLSSFVFVFNNVNVSENNEKMELKSLTFEDNGNIPSKYTCDSENVSPPLMISEVPDNAKSLVLIMDDPDALKPAGKIWDHWIIFNIPVETKEILENMEPEGLQGMTSFGEIGYGGPCPPCTEHKYFFKLYALDIKLNLPQGSVKQEVEEAMRDHIIEQTQLIGKYERVK